MVLMPSKHTSPPAEPCVSKQARTAGGKLCDPNNLDVSKAPQSLIPKQARAKVSSTSKKPLSKTGSTEANTVSDSEIEEVPSSQASKGSVSQKRSAQTEDKDKDGFLIDLEGLENVPEPSNSGVSRTKDVNHFFGAAKSDDSGKSKRKCVTEGYD
ncbi:hypothetical protein M422DRAFT_247352 [Sphaerobolus stellatus SS14]|nr:hypothetical protein M422DRAFT_247352 [Sphaerobolus stellatus SS14]